MITVSGGGVFQVSSTSNASLASAIKKRKAPVPPPALHEHVEASEKIPSPPTITVVVDGSHDDSDRVSSVSDQLSSVSDLSSTRKSETPDIIEPAIVVELTPQRHHYEQQQQTSGEQAEIQNWNNFFNELGRMLDLDSQQNQRLRVSNL